MSEWILFMKGDFLMKFKYKVKKFIDNLNLIELVLWCQYEY